MNESRKVMQAVELSLEMNVDKNKILQVFNKVNKGAANLERFLANEMLIVERQFFKLIALCQEFPTDWELKDEMKRFEYVYTKKAAI